MIDCDVPKNQDLSDVSSGGINGQFPSSLEQFLSSSGQFLVTLVFISFY